VDAPLGACVCGIGASGNAAEADVDAVDLDGAGGSEPAMAMDGINVQTHTKSAAVKRRGLCICCLRFHPSPHGCKRLLPVQTMIRSISFHYR
jgi:hypothetical protein